MLYAVEIKCGQVKKLGHPSNLYIVEGEKMAFSTSGKGVPGAVKCEITTRVGSSKNRIGYLAKSVYPVVGLDPRPNHQHQWEQKNGYWIRR